MADKRQLIIIDNDAGTDDAEAIIYASYRSNDYRLIGLTCVGGNIEVDAVVANNLKIITACRMPHVLFHLTTAHTHIFAQCRLRSLQCLGPCIQRWPERRRCSSSRPGSATVSRFRWFRRHRSRVPNRSFSNCAERVGGRLPDRNC